MLRDQAAHFTDERENHLAITYENLTQSSYGSEVVLRAITFSRRDCYDLYSFHDPSIQDVQLQDFDPLGPVVQKRVKSSPRVKTT